MKLESLHLRNWRGLADMALPLSSAEPTIITGPNGAGKTSILQAVEWLFTGKSPVGQAHSAGLLREGQKQGWVQTTFLGGETVRRNIPQGLEIEGLPAKASAGEAEQRLMALAGVATTAGLGRALRPDLFLQLAAKDQAAAFYEILNARVTKEMVAEKLAKAGVASTYEKHVGPVHANIDAAYKKLFDARRDAKRDLKEAEAVLAKLEADEADGRAPAFRQGPDPEKRAALQAALVEKSKQAGSILQAGARRKKLEEQAKSLRAQLQGAKGAEWLEGSRKLLAQLETQAAELDRPASRLQAVRQELSTLRGGACCVACGRPWEDAEDRAARVIILTQEEQQLVARAVEENKLQERLADGRAKIAQAERLEGLRPQLAEVEAELGEAVGDTTELDAEISLIREDLRRLDAQAEEARESQNWIDRKREAGEKVGTLSAEVEALETLVALFGPHGIKREVLKKACDPVGEQLTGTLSNWGMAAKLSEDLVLEVERNGLSRPAYACSDGERILVALALQVWLAEQSGTRIILCDRLEALDEENLTVLISACEQLLESGAIDHAFLAGVDLACTPTVTLQPTHQLLEV